LSLRVHAPAPSWDDLCAQAANGSGKAPARSPQSETNALPEVAAGFRDSENYPQESAHDDFVEIAVARTARKWMNQSFAAFIIWLIFILAEPTNYADL
jgi:hypothetical protein